MEQKMKIQKECKEVVNRRMTDNLKPKKGQEDKQRSTKTHENQG